MTYTVQGDSKEVRTATYDRIQHGYTYPNGLDLDPKSEFHEKIRNKVWQRARESRMEISKRFPSWDEIDRVLTTYIPLDDAEKALKDKDPRKPVSIIFPYSYSNMESLLTYLSMAFFQDPMFQYEGVEDDDTIGSMLMELLVRIQCIKSKVPLAIHTCLRDNLGYGVGIGLPGWIRRYGKIPVKSSATTISELGESSEEFTNYIDGLVYEGNSLSNIDPRLWLPDTSVSSDKIQDGEFVGWIDRTSYINLLSEEGHESNLFNVKYLDAKKDGRSSLNLDNSQRETKFGGPSYAHQGLTNSTKPVDTISMYINLIPKEWELSTKEYPEKWFFKLAADDVIISCHKADHYHGLYPIAVCSSEYDGYSATPIGKLEVLLGLQNTLDFEFNTHVANIRKALNDMFVVDPYLVNIKDMEDPKPGKLIRLRRPAWGHGVDKVVQQLMVNDVTRGNMADASYMTGWMDRISGADQSMSGVQRQGGPERLTGKEFQGTRGSAISRLQHMAMIISMQFMQDIGSMFAVHNQQYLSQPTYAKIIGKYEDQLKAIYGRTKTNVRIEPKDLLVNYDLIVRDGSIPGGNFSDSWIQLFQIISTSPELMQQFDMVRIFMYIAKETGAKNVEDFKRVVNQTNVVTQPDEQVLREAEKGNIVPMGGI